MDAFGAHSLAGKDGDEAMDIRKVLQGYVGFTGTAQVCEIGLMAVFVMS